MVPATLFRTFLTKICKTTVLISLHIVRDIYNFIIIIKEKESEIFASNTHLDLINGTSVWISVTVNNDSIVALVYKVRTSTYIVQMWGTPCPILQLFTMG